MIFHHVGIACKNINATLEFVKKHFRIKSVSEIIFDELQNANLCMIEMEDGYQMELISGEIVKNFLKKGQQLYHTCYCVESIEKTLKELESECFILGEAKKAILFGGNKVVFLMTPIGLIELLETKV